MNRQKDRRKTRENAIVLAMRREFQKEYHDKNVKYRSQMRSGLKAFIGLSNLKVASARA